MPDDDSGERRRYTNRLDIRVAVLEAQQETIVSDLHDVKADIKSAARTAYTNLWTTVVAAVTIILTIIAARLH